jgi:O-antigen/teichoic acid export membrane protein
MQPLDTSIVTEAQIGLRANRATGTARRSSLSPQATVVAAWRRHKDLLSNAGSLLATTGVTSGLGFAFWTFAAREFSQKAVGYGSAAVSAITLLGTIGVFGLGTVLIGELPNSSRRAGLVSAALLASGLGSLLLGLGFAVVAPLVSRRFVDILGDPVATVTFISGVVLTAVTSVFDQATIGLLRGGVQLSRNLVFAIFKMLALPVTAVMLHDQLGIGISLSWVAGIAASLAGSAMWLRGHGSPVMPRPNWAVLRALGKTAVAHNWLNLAIAVPYSLMPVLVTVIVSPSANAAFYIAWMLVSFLYAVPTALSTVLFAVAAAEPQVISRKLRFALKVSLLIGLPAMLALCFGAHFALSLFGTSYAKEAEFPLWLLSLTYLPVLPKSYYIAVCRATGRVSRAAAVLTTFAVAEIAAAGVGGSVGGLRGLSIAIFVVTAIEGLGTSLPVLRAAIGYGRHRKAGIAAQADDSTRDAYSGRRPDYVWSPQATSYGEDRQAAGIAALVWLARCTAPTVPFTAIKTEPRYPAQWPRPADPSASRGHRRAQPY